MALFGQADGQPRTDPPASHDDDVHRTMQHGGGRHDNSHCRRDLPGDVLCLPEGVNEVGPPTATSIPVPGSGDGDGPPPSVRRGDRSVAPVALPSPASPDLPETLRYRLKNTLLGPPIASERQSTERLGKPTALAVLSSDVISSSAYATEQILSSWSRSSGSPPSPS